MLPRATRGTRRDDIRPSLHVTHHRNRAVIAFAVDPTAEIVSIPDLFYGGQDYAADLSDPPRESLPTLCKEGKQ